MNFQLALHNVLSDPSFEPPEGLFELNLKGSFEDLLKSYSSKACIEFIVGEAWLVLPIWEAKFPDDSRPRDAIVAAEMMRNIPGPFNRRGKGGGRHSLPEYVNTAAGAVNTAVACGAAEACAAARAAWAAYNAVYYTITSYTAISRDTGWGADAARRADSSITLMDQLRRLFNLGGIE